MISELNVMMTHADQLAPQHKQAVALFIERLIEQQDDDLAIAEGIADADAGRVIPMQQVWDEWDSRQKVLFPALS
jgi:predicted transcriptional regulator